MCIGTNPLYNDTLDISVGDYVRLSCDGWTSLITANYETLGNIGYCVELTMHRLCIVTNSKIIYSGVRIYKLLIYTLFCDECRKSV